MISCVAAHLPLPIPLAGVATIVGCAAVDGHAGAIFIGEDCPGPSADASGVGFEAQRVFASRVTILPFRVLHLSRYGRVNPM